MVNHHQVKLKGWPLMPLTPYYLEQTKPLPQQDFKDYLTSQVQECKQV
jgi:hypothetical protein